MTSPARVLTLLLPTAIALYASFQGVQAILVPDRVEAIDPAAQGRRHRGVMTVICAATGVAGLVAVGAASDATRGRFGRRAPWLAGMAALSLVLAALAVAAAQPRRRRVELRRAVVHAERFSGGAARGRAGPGAGAAAQPRLVAVRRRRADRRPRRHQPRSAAAAGARLFRAVSAISGDDGAVSASSRREAPFDRRRRRARAPGRLRFAALASFGSRDFALAFAFRLLMFSAQFAINNYLLYILRDYVGAAALPGHDARGAAGLARRAAHRSRRWRDLRRTSPRRPHLAPPRLRARLRRADGAGDAGAGAVADLGRDAGVRRPRRRRDGRSTPSSTSP